MKKVLYIVLLFCVLLIGCANAGEVTYTDFSQKVDFVPVLGGEFPGTEADYSIDPTEGEKGDPCLKCVYDFHETGMYTVALFDMNNEKGISSATGMTFSAKGEVGESILLRINDSKGECFQQNFPIENDGFNKYTVDFAEMEKGLHFGGDANNVLDFPISSVMIGPNKGEVGRGVFYLDNIAFISSDTNNLSKEIFEIGLGRLNFKLDTGKPGNLFYFGEPLTAKILPENNILPPFSVIFSFEYFDSYGKRINHKVKSLSFKSGSPKSLDLPKIKGYCEIKWTAKIDNKYTKEGSFYYGVIPDNSKIVGEKDSYFGVNCHFNQGWPAYFGDIVKRAGISWVRDGEATYGVDKAYPVCKALGLQYMPCFTGMQEESLKYIEKELSAGKKASDKWDFSSCIQMYGDYAKQYGDYVFIYDMLNEPHNFGWSKFGGDWRGGDWLVIFTEWSKQASKIVRDNDKDAKILWEDMDGNLWSDKYIEYGVTDKDCDYISQHPYNLHRSVPLPENQGFRETNERFWERNKEKGLNWRLIDGEVGFPTFEIDDNTSTPYYTGYPLALQPALIVRMYVMHLTSGVDRIFYYDFRNDGYEKNNPECNFGLVLNDGNPKPAICGYANLVNILDGGKMTGRVDMGDENIHVYGFTDRDGREGVVAWTPTGEETVSVKTKSSNPVLIDIYGNETKLTPKDLSVTLKLTEYPVYVLFK
ncbi:MAG: hypothetical protein IJS60_04495 [Abditibacteriota bacterium]|nr:hypothetical protein [Abditibacteriota bacterium]